MLVVTDHKKIIEKHAEAIAFSYAKTIDGYVNIYVKKRPRYMPKFLYRYILSKVLVLAHFKEL